MTLMNAGQSIWDKLFRLVLALLVTASLMGIFLWYQPVIQENQRLRRDELELEKKIGRKVDLVEYGAIKPYIKNSILSGEVRII